MGTRPASLRLDRLNVPAEDLRGESAPREMRKLRTSLERHGVLVPLVVRPLGGGEYAVVDGSRRLRVLRHLGRPGSTEVPVLVLDADDARALVAQVQINQVRERLSSLSEAEALKGLVQDQGWTQADAARELGKTKSWASHVMRVFALPAPVVRDLRAGRLSLGHARVLTSHTARPRLFALLHGQARRGQISKRQLSVLGKRLAREGGAAARLRPRRHRLGALSWVRIEPLLEGLRAELHLHDGDNARAALDRLAELVRAARGKAL